MVMEFAKSGPLLEISDLAVSFGTVSAVKRVSLRLDRGETLAPVSYTHLDVYKRQVPDPSTLQRLRWITPRA